MRAVACDRSSSSWYWRWNVEWILLESQLVLEILHEDDVTWACERPVNSVAVCLVVVCVLDQRKNAGRLRSIASLFFGLI